MAMQGILSPNRRQNRGNEKQLIWFVIYQVFDKFNGAFNLEIATIIIIIFWNFPSPSISFSLIAIFFFFFWYVCTRRGREIWTSNPRFIRRSLNWLNYLLRTSLLAINLSQKSQRFLLYPFSIFSFLLTLPMLEIISYWRNFTYPLNFQSFCRHPPVLKNSYLGLSNFGFLSLYPFSYRKMPILPMIPKLLRFGFQNYSTHLA